MVRKQEIGSGENDLRERESRGREVEERGICRLDWSVQRKAELIIIRIRSSSNVI